MVMSTVVFRTKRLLDFFKVENNWKRNNFCSLVQTVDDNDEPSVLEFFPSAINERRGLIRGP